MEKAVAVYVAAVLVCGVVAQWVGWRFRVPAIVLLLGLGPAFGPGLGLLHPSQDFGRLYRPLVGLSVALVVFEGGLTLNLRELRQAGPGVMRLILVGLPVNGGLGAAAAHWVGGLSWPVAAVVGAILVVTGPTVILPLLRQARLRRRIASLLKWEAVVNDPIGAILSVVVLQVVVGQAAATKHGAWHLAGHLGGAALLAVVGAVLLAWLVRRAFHADQVPEELRTPLLLAGAFGLYAACNVLVRDTGLLGATLFGLVLANSSITGLASLARFKQALTTLVVSILFILLAADIDRSVIAAVDWHVAAFVAIVLLVVRPVSIALASLGAGLSWRERALLAWAAPRGIVAAAVSGLAGRAVTEAGYQDGRMLLPMVFGVIAATVVLQGLTLTGVARLLGLRSSERPGLLIIGASPWSLALAGAVREAEVPVQMADASWARLRPARELGIATMAADVLSQRVDELGDTTDIDYALAATDNDAYNALVCARLAPELGRERVHQLALQSGRLDSHAVARDWRGKVVAESGLDIHNANQLLDEGWRFRLHPVGGQDAGREAADKHSAVDKPILLLRPDGTMAFHSPEQPLTLRSGDRLVVFEAPTAGSTAERPRAMGDGGGHQAMPGRSAGGL